MKILEGNNGFTRVAYDDYIGPVPPNPSEKGQKIADSVARLGHAIDVGDEKGKHREIKRLAKFGLSGLVIIGIIAAITMY